MTIYAGLQSTASRLINKYGQEYTFTKVTKGAYNPATGAQPTTETTYKAYAVRDSYSVNERSGSAIETGDIKLLAVDGDYSVNDYVSIDGDDYQLINVEPIKPADTGLAYELQVRK